MSVLINILIKCFSQPKSLFFSPDFGEIRTFSWAWALCLLCLTEGEVSAWEAQGRNGMSVY